MNKGIFFLAVFLLAATLLAGGKTEEERPLQFWTLFSGGDGEKMDAIVAKYNSEYPEDPVETLLLEWAEYYTKIESAIAANRAPDIGISHLSRLPQMFAQGLIYPLDEYQDQQKIVWSNYNQNILAAATIEGKHYAIPIDTHPFVLYYNKDLLAKSGLLNSQGEPNFIDDQRSFATALSTLKADLPQGTYALSIPGNNDTFRLFWGIYQALGGQDFINQEQGVLLDEELAKEAITFYFDFFKQGYAAAGLDWESYTRLFQNGRAALMYNGVWTTNLLAQQSSLNFGAITQPKIFSKAANWGDAHALILPKQAKKDDARLAKALRFMNYVAEQGAIWAEAGHVPAYSPVLKEQAYLNLPYRKGYSSAAESVAFEPNYPNNWAVRDIVGEELSALFNGKTASIEQAVSTMKNRLNRLYQRGR